MFQMIIRNMDFDITVVEENMIQIIFLVTNIIEYSLHSIIWAVFSFLYLKKLKFQKYMSVLENFKNIPLIGLRQQQ